MIHPIIKALSEVQQSVIELISQLTESIEEARSEAKTVSALASKVLDLQDNVRRWKMSWETEKKGRLKTEIERDRMKETLAEIQEWAKAYPIEVFPEPDLAAAHQALQAAGMSLDQVSAQVARIILGKIIAKVEKALEAES